ncbi:hypothetical protein [Bdellovibrio sp. HCB337]|uniref:hypothetical protein n=1 Tax=Bdellovibrio sp. HCB337 TaxID=3394358 RepID=UPI0039A4E6D3
MRKLPLFVLTFLLLNSGCSFNFLNRYAATEDQLERAKSQLNADFKALEVAIENLDTKVEEAYKNKTALIPKANKSQYKTAPTGVYYREPRLARSDVWLSAYKKQSVSAKEVLYFTESLEEDFQNTVSTNEAIVQVYYNSKDSMCKIFPPVDSVKAFDPKMIIPEFNFYYMANETHNPEKKVVWVDEPYLDPAGRGFMISGISPIYVDSNLEGVAGIDIRLATLTDKYSRGDNEGIVLVHETGLLVSASNRASEVLNLPPFKEKVYESTVKKDTFRTDEYNLSKHKDPQIQKLLKKCLSKEHVNTSIDALGKTVRLSCSRLGSIHWLVISLNLN